MENMLTKDISDNKAIGKYGAESIITNADSTSVNILTHCNTGALATAGYGTALGVIRNLFENSHIGINRLKIFGVCYFMKSYLHIEIKKK